MAYFTRAQSDQEGTVKLNHRRGEDKIIAKDMIGKPFLLRVRDNGWNYGIYFHGNKFGEGAYARPKGKITSVGHVCR